jgi:diguanylate cyclase (GGDEF)-like protein
MKRLITAFALALGWATVAWPAPPAPLTTLGAVHALSNAEASQGLPVAFEATVTYFNPQDLTLFVQDDGSAVYVQLLHEVRIAPGDRVLVRGVTHEGFRPEVLGESVTRLRSGELPMPVASTFDQLIRGQRDCLRVTVRGTIRTAHQRLSASHALQSQMLMEGGIVRLTLDSGDAGALDGLLDAQVEVTGVASGIFDGRDQMVGIELDVPRFEDIRVLQRAGASPWSLPVTPMDEIITTYHERILSQRTLIRGVITYVQPGSFVVLQNGDKTLRVMTGTYTPLRIGDLADATGFPSVVGGFLTLTSAEVRDSYQQERIPPRPASWEQLSSGSNIFNLVTAEGEMVMEARESAQDEYVLVSGGHLFSAIYHHPNEDSRVPLAAMKQIPPGSKVRVTGICDPYTFSNDAVRGPVAFDILLRSFDDVTVIAPPSLLSIRNLILLAVLLLVAVVIVGVRGWMLERKVRRQTVAMAAHTAAEAELERRRSRILEDINGSRPLAEILEQITEMVSSMLNGAPCWCEVTDGARLGIFQPPAESRRIVRQAIPARSGPPLGALFARLDSPPLPDTDPAIVREKEALSTGAKLATLAIETRRLYSDLLHRSEFDLLTDIHNRFSLEKRLDTQIEEARENAGIFGLIYVDLDGFKQVNDIYGHHVGDLYLQEVAERMKRQLRPHDLLARLGGDEFAVLLTKVRNRAGVEEIAQRLEHSFDTPLILEGHTLHGTASFGIALYPEDSASKDGLLNAADAAMYTAKNRKRQVETLPPER